MVDVSIVVPTRDRPDLLRQALTTAVAQRGVDVEVIVVDDGSTGNTARVAEAVAGSAVRVLAHPWPRGVSAARNTGIAASSARWVALLDDDDLWAPDKLRRQLDAAAAAAGGARWAYAGEVVVDASLLVVAGEPPPSPTAVLRELRHHNAVPAGCSNVLVDRGLLDEAGPFDETLRNQEDWDMWIRLAALGPPVAVVEPLVAIRAHRGAASRDTANMLRELEIVARRHDLPVDRARHRRWAAWMALEDGRRAEAARHYAHAVAAGDVLSLGRAAVALGIPSVARRRGGRADPAWAARARSWLDGLPPT